MIPVIPILFAIAGLLTYALSSNPKITEIGRITFFVGLFFTVAHFAGSVLGIH